MAPPPLLRRRRSCRSTRTGLCPRLWGDLTLFFDNLRPTRLSILGRSRLLLLLVAGGFHGPGWVYIGLGIIRLKRENTMTITWPVLNNISPKLWPMRTKP